MYIIKILTIVDMIYKAWSTQHCPCATYTVCANKSHPTLIFELDVIGIASHYIYRTVKNAIVF